MIANAMPFEPFPNVVDTELRYSDRKAIPVSLSYSYGELITAVDALCNDDLPLDARPLDLYSYAGAPPSATSIYLDRECCVLTCVAGDSSKAVTPNEEHRMGVVMANLKQAGRLSFEINCTEGYRARLYFKSRWSIRLLSQLAPDAYERHKHRNFMLMVVCKTPKLPNRPHMENMDRQRYLARLNRLSQSSRCCG